MLKLPVKYPIVDEDIDLSEYAKKSDVDAINASLDNKADKKEVEKISSQLDNYTIAEKERVDNENLRVAGETGRVSAEKTRVSQESARVTAELGRVNAESERVAAEKLRITAEQNREENAITLEARVNEKISEYNTATLITNAEIDTIIANALN